jgi:polar amino acid transport system substrate-binding protein
VLAPSFTPAQLRMLLAPTGTLRVAVYPGSPTSMLPATASLPMRGVAVEVGRSLAQRLEVPVEIIVLPRVAEVVQALKDGRADMTVTNATAERAKDIDFPYTLLSLELGVLVRAGSPLTSLEFMDAPGLRLGVSQGSSSQREWAPRLSHSSLIAYPTLQSAAQALVAGQVDAFITNKGILFELADSVPGARILEGRWGLEHLALAVPQGRQAAVWELRRFAAAQVANGAVARAAANAGLRGHLVTSLVPAGGNAPGSGGVAAGGNAGGNVGGNAGGTAVPQR